MRADSVLNRLPIEQRDKVEGWLFEEGASYMEVRDRAQKQWNVICSVSAVGRFFRCKVKFRTLDELDEAKETARAINRSKVKAEALESAAIKVISKRLLDCAMNNGPVEELAALGKLLSDAKMRQIQQGRLKLMREKFEYSAVHAAMAELPYAQKHTYDDLERDDLRVEAFRHRLFGSPLPDVMKEKERLA